MHIPATTLNGSRGVATNANTGITVAGSKATVGNAQTGNEVTAARRAVYNPNTGQAISAAGVKGEQGSAVRVGDDVYATHDGNVYKKTDSGWQQSSGSGNWNSTAQSAQTSQLDRSYGSRTTSQQRSQAYSSAQPSSASRGAARTAPSGGGRRR